MTAQIGDTVFNPDVGDSTGVVVDVKKGVPSVVYGTVILAFVECGHYRYSIGVEYLEVVSRQEPN